MSGKKLRALRKQYKMTQVELGEIIGVSSTTIRNIETDKKKTSKKVLNALAKYFKIDVDELMNDDDYIIALELLDFIDMLIDKYNLIDSDSLGCEVELEMLKYISNLIDKRIK